MSCGSREEMNRKIAYAAWPLGLVLVLAYTMGGAVPRPLFLLLDAALAVGYALVLRRVARDPAATALAVAGVGLFVLVGVVGPPTARRTAGPAAQRRGAARGGGGPAGRGRRRSRCRAPTVPTVLAVVALAVGSVGYLLNLLARWAVVLSGAAPAQAAVEDRAWIASSYLRGPRRRSVVPDVPAGLVRPHPGRLRGAGLPRRSPALARRAPPRRHCRPRWSHRVAVGRLDARRRSCWPGGGGAGCDGPLGTVGAWTAFVLTIPFMSTLLPHVLGVALLPTARGGCIRRRPQPAGLRLPSTYGESSRLATTPGRPCSRAASRANGPPPVKAGGVCQLAPVSASPSSSSRRCGVRQVHRGRALQPQQVVQQVLDGQPGRRPAAGDGRRRRATRPVRMSNATTSPSSTASVGASASPTPRTSPYWRGDVLIGR